LWLGGDEASDVGSDVTAASFLGLAGVVFMFGLAAHASSRAGSHGSGAFAAYSAVAGVRLLADVLLPLLPAPWITGAGFLRHLTVWIGPLLGLLFALRFAAAARGAGRVHAAPFLAVGMIVLAVVFSNPAHGLYLHSPWASNSMDFGPIGWGMVAITNLAVLYVVVVLAAAMRRADGRRVPLALVITGATLNWSATALPVFAWSPFGFGQVDVVMRTAAAGLYAIALFGFGLLRLVPIGRDAVLRRMDQGWLVLDPGGRIADLNPAAEQLFGVAPRSAIGREAPDVLRGIAGLDAIWRSDSAVAHDADARATVGDPERHLDVHVTPVLNLHGTLLGRVLLVRDVTALRRAEALELERERALATLQERERVARELHDGLAQVLGFARLQAEAARGLLRHDPNQADAHLSRLAEAALDAHGEVRAFIAGSAAGARVGWLTALAATVRRVRDETGLHVEFRVDPRFDADTLAEPVSGHLLRIVQEALHNVRKHAGAQRVAVDMKADDAWLQVVVADDGIGIAEPALAHAHVGFGLRFMHERAAAVGGSLDIASGPDAGTRVTVRVPRREAPAVTSGPSLTAPSPDRGGV
jgi:PAS domain S-box-containing protein